MDPRAPWSEPNTVRGFAQGRPNPVLMQWIGREAAAVGRPLLVADIGCGAGRNAVPIAETGHAVVGVDLSRAMLDAALARTRDHALNGRAHWLLSPADALPLASARFDVVIAHGIWNLSRSSDEFRRGVREAARVARSGALLFVFTFSRHTLPESVMPVAGETFVFTQFSGQPQCFLTADELIGELAAAGFAHEPGTTLQEYNRPAPGALSSGAPVIWEAVFRRQPS